MRTTSNPAFRNLPAGGYAGFGSAPAGLAGQSGYAGTPTTTERPMTVDDVVTKTGITLAVLVTAAAATWISGLWASRFRLRSSASCSRWSSSSRSRSARR